MNKYSKMTYGVVDEAALSAPILELFVRNPDVTAVQITCADGSWREYRREEDGDD